MSSGFNFDIGAFQAGLSGAQERIASIEERRNKRNGRQALFDEAIDELNAELEELQVANEELCIQNDALAHAANDLAAERLRYKHLFDRAPDAFITTDVYGNIREANDAACKLLNLKTNYLRRKPLISFIPEPGKKQFRQILIKLKDDQDSSVKDLQLMPRDTREPIYITATATPVVSDAAEIIDIHWVLKSAAKPAKPFTAETLASVHTETAFTTHQGGADTKTNTIAREWPSDTPGAEILLLKGFLEAHSQLWSIREVSALLDYAVMQVARLLGTNCFLSLLSADKKHLVPMAAGSSHERSGGMLSHYLQSKPAPVSQNAAAKVLKNQQPLIIGSEAENINGRLPKSKDAAVSMLMVPLRVGDQSLGIITLLRERNQQSFPEQEIALVQSLADHVALILQINNLAPMAKRAAEGDTATGEFLADLCTELQGPMHALDGFAYMLREQLEETDLADMQADARCLCEAAAQVNQTLADLRDLSRIETIAVKPVFERISIREFLDDIETEIRNITGRQDFTLGAREEYLDFTITTDTTMAIQAVDRLVTSTRCAPGDITMTCACMENHLTLIFACEGGLFAENPLPPACRVSYSNHTTIMPSESSPTYRGVALVLAGRICQALGGQLEVEVNDDAIAKAVLTFPLH